MTATVHCPACESRVGNPDALYCGSCGESLPRNISCRKCGCRLPPQAKYCECCGAASAAAAMVADKQDVVGFCAGSGKAISGGDPCFVCMECSRLYLEDQRFEEKPICLGCAFGSGMAELLEQEKAARSEASDDSDAKPEEGAVNPLLAIETLIGAELWLDLPAGEFAMGSDGSEPERGEDERQHVVAVESFQMLATPVSFTMYDQFCREQGVLRPGDEGWGRANRPVINVSYWDAVAFCGWLSERTGDLIRLPTEAEWEYACRAGTQGACWMDGGFTANQANFDASRGAANEQGDTLFRKKTVPVDLFPPNPWGLYDMCGNVWEWCASEYDPHYGGLEVRDASFDASNQSVRALRGGSWASSADKVRSATRGSGRPDGRLNKAGFRVVRLNEDARRRAEEEAAGRRGRIEHERKVREAAELRVREAEQGREQAELRAEEATRAHEESERQLQAILAESKRVESEFARVQQAMQSRMEQLSSANGAVQEIEIERGQLEALRCEEAYKLDVLRAQHEVLVGELEAATAQRDACLERLGEVARASEEGAKQLAAEEEAHRLVVLRLQQLEHEREVAEQEATAVLQSRDDAIRESGEISESCAEIVSRIDQERQAVEAARGQLETFEQERREVEAECIALGEGLGQARAARQALRRKHAQAEGERREEEVALERVRQEVDDAVSLRQQAEQQVELELEAKETALCRVRESAAVREAIENGQDYVQQLSELTASLEASERRGHEQDAARQRTEMALNEASRDRQMLEERLAEADVVRLGLEQTMEELVARLQQGEGDVDLPAQELLAGADAVDAPEEHGETVVREAPESSEGGDVDGSGVEVEAEPPLIRRVESAESGMPDDNSGWVSVPLGSFYMGSPDTEAGRSSDELQRHVHVNSFQMLKTAVTFSMYDHFCDDTDRPRPSDEGWERGDRPVINVSFHDAESYCRWLGDRLGANVSLPTEIEWEYACRAGSRAPYWMGNSVGKGAANFSGGSVKRGDGIGVMTLPVGAFQPNPWGLFEMSGNVWEWCASMYHGGDGTGRPVRDSAPRVLRGGAWASDMDSLRSARRVGAAPTALGNRAGFRVVIRD